MSVPSTVARRPASCTATSSDHASSPVAQPALQIRLEDRTVGGVETQSAAGAEDGAGTAKLLVGEPARFQYHRAFGPIVAARALRSEKLAAATAAAATLARLRRRYSVRKVRAYCRARS